MADTDGSLEALLLDDDRDDGVSFAGRAIGLVLLAVWTWTFARATIASNAAGQSWLHVINLVFHEAGHVLFMPFGQFVMVLGGSLLQVLVPLVCMVTFLTRHRDVFGALVTWWWAGQNLVDLAPYINDARALRLVLLGGRTGAEVEGHDWEYLLTRLGWLTYDVHLARLAHALGLVMMCSALAWGVLVLVRHRRRLVDQ